MAPWKATVSGSACVRRRSSTGVRSPPPPNHHFDVTTMRVFMCAVGTLGLTGWAMSDTPEAQKRGSASAPGICLRNSGANSPCTVEVWMPAFSNTRPAIRLMVPPPPGAPPCSARVHGVRRKRAAARSPNGAVSGSSASSRSKDAHRSSRSASNQTRARSLCSFRDLPAVGIGRSRWGRVFLWRRIVATADGNGLAR